MMVDTSVWIDYINGAANWQVQRLRNAIASSSTVVVTPIINANNGLK